MRFGEIFIVHSNEKFVHVWEKWIFRKIRTDQKKKHAIDMTIDSVLSKTGKGDINSTNGKGSFLINRPNNRRDGV